MNHLNLKYLWLSWLILIMSACTSKQYKINKLGAIDPIHEIGSPLFDRITIHLNQDYYQADKFVITTNNNEKDSPYIISSTLNDKPLKNWFIRHSDINKVATLHFEMSNQPKCL